MERQSTQHSPRVDDEMEREVRSLTHGAPIEARENESRMMEGPGDGEPLPDAVVSMSDLELRSLIAASLRPSAFPGDREQLLAVALAERAEPFVVDLLYALPADRVFPTPEAVWEQLGGKVEVREPRPSHVRTEPAEATPAPEVETHFEIAAARDPLIVQGAAFAVGMTTGAVALAVGVVREVCGRVRRLL